MFNSTFFNESKLCFLRDTLVQGISREIVKYCMENKLDQNMQPVTLGNMHSTIELYKYLEIEKIIPDCINTHLDQEMQIRFDQHR